MKTKDFDYDLPPELIAQVPLKTRHNSRLLVYSRSQDRITHSHFKDISQFLTPGDVLVINKTRVIPARLFAHKETGGKVEVLLLKKLEEGNQWEVLVGGKRVTKGKQLTFGDGIEGEVLAELEGAKRVIQFNQPVGPHLKDLGEMPLPPYIHVHLDDPDRYQTVYAKIDGSAAAPTAGLHFTDELMAELRDFGVIFCRGDVACRFGHICTGSGREYRRTQDSHRMVSGYPARSTEDQFCQAGRSACDCGGHD